MDWLSFYYVQSVFDDNYYTVKKRRIIDTAVDLQTDEQKFLTQNCLKHENIQSYYTSFYLNKGMYTLMSAT